MAYKLKVNSVATDGTTLFFDISVFDGEHTFPPIRPSFPAGTSASTIDTYLQTIVDTAPTLATGIANLIHKEYSPS